jgi:hypothetical protein
MNLKAKLNILKSHTFFLLGPSSFKLWFESYLSITVRSLSFLEIAIQSPSSTSLPPPLFLCALPPLLCRPCAVHLPAPEPPWGCPRAAPVPTPPLPGLLLASPCRLLSARAALHRRSPLLHPAPPPASWRPHVLLPVLSLCSCAPCPSMFAGPSPGSRVPQHGRRHSSSPAMLRRDFSSTSPTTVTSSLCRPHSTGSSPAKPSPPARTPWTETPDAVESRRGRICDFFFCSRVLCASNQGPQCKTLCYFMCAKKPVCKIHTKL